MNSREPSTILRNDSHTGHHWIQLELRGVQGNRDGVGAQVTVVAGELSQVQEVHSGRSYQSHFGSRLSFGLGPRDRVDRIEVRWLGGATQVFRDVSIDQRWLILRAPIDRSRWDRLFQRDPLMVDQPAHPDPVETQHPAGTASPEQSSSSRRMVVLLVALIVLVCLYPSPTRVCRRGGKGWPEKRRNTWRHSSRKTLRQPRAA